MENNEEKVISEILGQHLKVFLKPKYPREESLRLIKKKIRETLNNPGLVILKENWPNIIISILIKNNEIKSQSELDELIEKTPFLQKNLNDIVFTKLKNENGNECIKNCDTDFDEEDEEEVIKNYNVIPSPYLINDPDWYKKIGLKSDPFPSENGLYLISPTDYDNIVIKTPIYQKYINLIEKDLEKVLNISTVIYGDFGCGKTTFFDYLSYLLLKKDVVPIRIILNAKTTLSALQQEFSQDLFDESCDYYRQYSIDPRVELNGQSKSDTLKVFQLIMQERNQKGFLIFLDGLHKSQNESNIALEFIVGLQNTLEYFRLKKVKIGILIAGSNDWKNRIDRDKAISGSVINMEKMDDLNPKLAYEMLERRFNTFATIPNKKYLQSSDIELLINIISKTLASDITFRLIIKTVQNKGFIVKNKIKFNLNLEQDVLRDINNSIQNSQIVFKRISELKEECKDVEDSFHHLLKVISATYDSGYFYTDDPYFLKKKQSFEYLMSKGIIQINKGYKKNNQNAYVLNSDFNGLFKDIENKVKYRPGHYLHAIFCHNNPLMPNPSQNLNIVETLTRYSDSTPIYRTDLEQLLVLLKNEYLELIQKIEKSPTFQITTQDTQGMNKIIEKFLRFIYSISNEPFILKTQKELFDYFRYNWLMNRILTQYFTFEENWQKKNSNIQMNQQYLKIFTETVESLVFKLGKHIRYNSILQIGSQKLNDEDKKKLNDARGLYAEAKYDETIIILHDHFEKRLRLFIFHVLFLIYGSNWTQKIPAEMIKQIDKHKKKELQKFAKQLNNEENILFYLTRSSYAPIINDDYLWNHCFRYIFGDSYRLYVKETLDGIAYLANLPKHCRENEEMGEIALLIQKNFGFLKEVLEKVNEGYIKILNQENVLESTNELKFTFEKGNDQSDLEAIAFNSDQINSVYDIIKSHYDKLSPELFELDLSNFRENFDRFAIDYRNFYGIIAHLNKKNQIKMYNIHGSKITIEIGEDILNGSK